MPAEQVDLYIEQGTSWGPRGWRPERNGQPVCDATWTVKAQVRSSHGSPTVLHEWSTERGNAEVRPTGEVLLWLDPADSQGWAWTAARYDVEVTSPGGETLRVAEGWVKVGAEVTR